jgi:uncharacterized membrane protein
MPDAIDLIAGMVLGIVGCFIVGYGLFLGTKRMVGERTNEQVFRSVVAIMLGLCMISFTIFAVIQALP